MGGLAFSPWPTPFADRAITLGAVCYKASQSRLTVSLSADGERHRIVFTAVTGFKVEDEAGLSALWGAGPRPARASFCVSGLAWASESPLTFAHAGTEAAFVIASDDDCVLVVSGAPPTIDTVPETTP